MGLNIKRLRELQKDLEKKARQEMMENISDELIKFVLDEDISQDYRVEKRRPITQQSKRVIGHWVKEGVIKGDQNTEGGWYYFSKTESIWIDIVTQLREFGLSLTKIKLIREKLFEEEISNFRLIDFALMQTVLKEPYVMIVYPDGIINLTKIKGGCETTGCSCSNNWVFWHWSVRIIASYGECPFIALPELSTVQIFGCCQGYTSIRLIFIIKYDLFGFFGLFSGCPGDLLRYLEGSGSLVSHMYLYCVHTAVIGDSRLVSGDLRYRVGEIFSGIRKGIFDCIE